MSYVQGRRDERNGVALSAAFGLDGDLRAVSLLYPGIIPVSYTHLRLGENTGGTTQVTGTEFILFAPFITVVMLCFLLKYPMTK